MAAGWPTKANYATGDVLSATNMNDLSGTVNLIAPTAKGDLYAGSAANTYTKLAVGTNGQYLQADSTTATGLKWASVSTSPTFVGCSLQKATQSIANSTQTALTWNVETNDSNGFHDNVTNNSRVTIPTGYAGRYLLMATLNWDQSNGTGNRYIRFGKNGTAVSETAIGLGAGGVPSATVIMTYTDIFNLAVGDYVEVFASQTSGGALSVNGNASGVGISNFNVVYLGA